MNRDSSLSKPADLPRGVGITTKFLGCFVGLMILPLAAASLACVGAIISLDLAKQPIALSVGLCLLSLVALMFVFSMMISATWLGQYLRANYYQGEPHNAPVRPDGFMVQVVEPLPLIGIGYSVLALFLGFANFDAGWQVVLIWTLFWGGFWAACHFLRRWMLRNPVF